MEDLAKDNPDFITLTDMGKSHEGRKILMLKVVHPDVHGDPDGDGYGDVHGDPDGDGAHGCGD